MIIWNYILPLYFNPNINCCIEAIRQGVHKVFIIDGRIPHSILIETLTDEGIGTMFVSGNYYEH